jgi:hypothetical protein
MVIAIDTFPCKSTKAQGIGQRLLGNGLSVLVKDPLDDLITIVRQNNPVRYSKPTLLSEVLY